MERHYYVYIMTNKNDRVLYTGITNDLKRRIYEHKGKMIKGFTKNYNITKLFIMRFSEMLKVLFYEKSKLKVGQGIRRLN